MSFDLYFLEREPGGTWQDAMERLEETAADSSPLDDADLARWDAVRDQVRPLLPRAEEFTGESHRELSDVDSGIQLSLSHGELALTTPYSYSGPDAQAMVDRLRSVAIAVEAATGLTAYDPQSDAAFVSGGDGTAAAAFDQVAAAVRPGAERPAHRPAAPADLLRRIFRRPI